MMRPGIAAALCLCSLLTNTLEAQYKTALTGVSEIKGQISKIRTDQPFDTSKAVAGKIAAACAKIKSALSSTGKSLTDDRKDTIRRMVATVKGQAEVTQSAAITWNNNLSKGNSMKSDVDIMLKQTKELVKQWDALENGVKSHRKYLHDTFKSWHAKRFKLLKQAQSLKSREESLEKKVDSQWKQVPERLQGPQRCANRQPARPGCRGQRVPQVRRREHPRECQGEQRRFTQEHLGTGLRQDQEHHRQGGRRAQACRLDGQELRQYAQGVEEEPGRSQEVLLVFRSQDRQPELLQVPPARHELREGVQGMISRTRFLTWTLIAGAPALCRVVRAGRSVFSLRRAG